MFNCVIMAMPPKKLNNATSPTDFFCLVDFFLNFVFLCEFIIKFSAYGLGYFRDTWNQLDFVVVLQGTMSMLTECPYIFGRNNNAANVGDISALRMMRVLRPLKSLRKFPEMRLLVGSLFGSFHLLLAIIVLTMMAVFVFAVFSTLYFGDALDYRCIPDPSARRAAAFSAGDRRGDGSRRRRGARRGESEETNRGAAAGRDAESLRTPLGAARDRRAHDRRV